jgi:CheY-like chemotaxis protein
LQEVSELCRLQAKRKNLSFTYQALTPLPGGVQVDEKHLRQVLINLLDNAIKFTAQGQVTLRLAVVSPVPTDPENPPPAGTVATIRFEVEDTGVGVPSDQVEKIFLPFEQVRDLTQHVEGSGLGLAISQKLVQMMGGDLKLTSEPDRGSTFWFELPLPVVAKEAVNSRSAVPPPALGYKGRRRTVLIVDDKDHNRAVLRDLLKPLGFEVIEADNGHQCLALAQQQQPDAILMDLIMPGMSGFEATQEIRQIPALKDVVIIAITASAFDADRQQSRLAGCNAFLPKPIRAETLFELLETHLQLEWVYQKQAPERKEPAEEGCSPGALTPPPQEEIIVLLDLARKGDMAGIQEQALHLERIDEKFRPFAAELRQLANSFEVKQIRELVDRYVE